MKRRQFISLLGGAAAAWPLAARAQQAGTPVIGYLNAASPETNPQYHSAFRQGLAEAGYVEGKNVAIEYRWADNQYDRLPALAADLVRRQVAVIAATGGPPAAVAAHGYDPDRVYEWRRSGRGRPCRQPRPAGWQCDRDEPVLRGTGGEAAGVLRDVMRKADAIAFLVNPNFPEGRIQLKDVPEAARAIGQELVVMKAGSESEIDAAFAALGPHKAGGLLVASDPLWSGHRSRIIALAARYVLPAIYYEPVWVAEGGLMSYGTDAKEMYRQAGIYVGRILKGANPADLPVMQPTKFELAINLKTAKALGLQIPDRLLALADEIIE